MAKLHEQCWDSIPWVVNGRASDTEQRDLLVHAEDCAECREELARHRELHEYLQGPGDVIPAPNASLQKLLAQIDAQPQIPAARSYRIRRPWLIAAMWVQCIAIALLTIALLRSPATPLPTYTTLAHSAETSPRAALRVVFAPDTSLRDINLLLQQVGCEVVAGPSEAGVYTLATARPGDVSQVLTSLRQSRDVLFAERSQTSAGRSP